MKKASKFDSKLMVGSLCLLAAGWMSSQGQSVPNAATQPEIPKQTETTPASDQPQRINRCSQLVGTRVENPQGDKLGKIDEVVLDLDTGRVSYCVLEVEHGLFAKAKYLAVPLAAMKPSADGSRLILNADKDKVAQAEGFDRDNWPSVTNPAWGAQPFWQTAPKATITTPSDQNQNKPSGMSH